MNRGVLAHGLFLLAAVSLAWWAWTDEGPNRRTAPVLLNAAPDELVSITYRWPYAEVVFEPNGKGEHRGFIARYTPTPEGVAAAVAARAEAEAAKAAEPTPAPRDPRAARRRAAPEKQPPMVTEPSAFPVSSFVVQTLEKLVPLQPRRTLGEMGSERLAEMGLVDPPRELVVEARRRRAVLQVGRQSYGSQAYYVRQPQAAEVHVLDGEIIRTLEGGPKSLMEARIVPVPPAHVLSMELAIGDRREVFEHHHKDQFRKRYFALPESPDLEAKAAGKLLTTLRTIRTDGFSEDSRPPGPALLEIRLIREKQPPYDVAFYEGANAETLSVTAGRWRTEIDAAEARKLIEEARALLR